MTGVEAGEIWLPSLDTCTTSCLHLLRDNGFGSVRPHGPFLPGFLAAQDARSRHMRRTPLAYRRT